MIQYYYESIEKQFKYYKVLGEKAIEQVGEEQLALSPNSENNSIAVIVKHLWGNMLSRWTNFLDSDGEKSWRNRDQEFENDIRNRAELMEKWEEGWHCLFNALESAKEVDPMKMVFIRNQGHTIIEAFNRQLAHYAYHIGQIVYLAKWHNDSDWRSLTIPRNKSKQFNQAKFQTKKQKKHFTDDFLNE